MEATIDALMRFFVAEVASKRVAKSLGIGMFASGLANTSKTTSAPVPEPDSIRPLASGEAQPAQTTAAISQVSFWFMNCPFKC